MERLGISVEQGHAGRILQIREHDRAETCVDRNSVCLRWRRWLVLDPATKSFDYGGLDFEHFVGNQAVSFVVRTINGFSIRRFNQTKRGTADLIEPVGQKLDLIFFLKSEILLVRIRHGMASRSFNVVAIHVDRHISTSNAENRAKTVGKS